LISAISILPAGSGFFKYAELGAGRTRICFQFFLRREDGLSRYDLSLADPSADADREILRADAGVLCRSERILHDAVFQGMEGNDRQPSAGAERIKRRL